MHKRVKGIKTYTIDSHQITREENKRRGEKNKKSKFKTINRMAIETHIAIISLNVNRLNAPNKTPKWLNGYKNRKLTSDLETQKKQK